MMIPQQSLSGVFVPVVTPFTNDKPDMNFLRSNLERLERSDVSGYFLLGSNGEARTLSEEEREKILELFASFRETATEKKTVMVGVLCESTSLALEEVRRIGAFGFDYASLLPPHYFGKRITDKVLIDFYTTVADNAQIPICIYNAPGFANGVDCSPAVIEALASHPNIVGMKDSSKPGPARFLARLEGVKRPGNTDFSVLAGSAAFFYPSLCIGAVGGVLSLANALPKMCAKLYSLFREKRYDEARTLNNRVVRLNAEVSGRYGVAGVKAAMDAAGYNGGAPRHPLPPLSEEERNRLYAIIQEVTEAEL